MKLHHLMPIAAIAAALAVPAAAPAATSSTGTSSVTADIADTLEATFPSSYSFGNLTPGSAGSESSAQTTVIKSNKAWGLKISSDIASGKMTEWDALLSAYVTLTPKVLTNPLQWKLSSLGGTAQTASFASISSTKAAVTTGQAATSDTGTAVGVTYKQVISYADATAGANDYRIVVNYDAAQGY